MSLCDKSLDKPLQPIYHPGDTSESTKCASIISTLKMQPHPEGGYYVETDRDTFELDNPFRQDGEMLQADNAKRNASTSIYYLVTPQRPQGNFHRNKARTVHTLHSGRGRYIIIHADEGSPARIETFVVGHDLEKGERLQWIVEGGKYKASYLLPDDEESNSSNGLLISETVVPGFDFRDHDFLSVVAAKQMIEPEQFDELSWLIRKE